jgi:hypothetical protein
MTTTTAAEKAPPLNFDHIDPNWQPFKDRSWSHTATQSCSLSLLAAQLDMPSSGRPDRFTTLVRRDEGSLLHDSAEMCTKLLQSHGKYPTPIKVVRRILETQYMALRGQEHEQRLAVKLLNWQENFVYDIDRMISCEWKLAIAPDGSTCSYENPVPGAWRVRIDYAEFRPDGGLRIIDYKNKPNIDTEAALKKHEQLAGYAWALGKMLPRLRDYETVTIGIYYFEYGFTREVEITWEEVDALFARQQARFKAKAALRIVDIKPEPGYGKCQYCDYIMECPDGSEMMSNAQSAPVDMETAKALASKVFIMQEILEASKKALRHWVQEHGNVEVSEGLGFGYKVSYENKSNVAAIIAEAKAADIELSDILSLNLAAAKRLAKGKPGEDDGNPKMSEILERHVSRVIKGSEFTDYHPEKDEVLTTPKISTKVKRARTVDGADKPKRESTRKAAKKSATTVASI